MQNREANNVETDIVITSHMPSDQEIIKLVQEAFRSEPRPEHFTDFSHCCECAEHNQLLSSRDTHSLKVEDVNNAAWDPICFITSDGFKYYLPALIRLALEGSTVRQWYLPQLLFHMVGDGPRNRRVTCCSRPQQRSITAFLRHVMETRSELISHFEIEEELHRAIEIWSEG